MNQDTAQRVDSKYLGIFLATNTSEGDAWNNYSHYLKTLNLVFSDLNLSGTYAYRRNLTFLYDATSSVNALNGIILETVNG
jgi:hypothetical protein